MINITILLLLAMFWSESAFAVVYQCRDKSGNIFLTNDRSKFPPGCVQFGEPFGEQPTAPAVSPAETRRSEPDMSDRRLSPSPPPSPSPQSTREETKPVAPETGTEPSAKEEE